MSSPVVKRGNKLKWVFDNIANWDGNLRFSDDFVIDNLNWNIGIKISTVNTYKYISPCLMFCGMENGKACVCTVDAQFTLLDLSGKNRHIQQKFDDTKNYVVYRNNVEEVTFLTRPWPAIIKCIEGYSENGLLLTFNKNNSITMEIEFDYTFHNYSNNIPNYTDVILKIEDVEVHASRRELYMNSEYFDDLFNVRKCEDPVIDMENVKLGEFLPLLVMMNPKNWVDSSSHLNKLKSGNFEKYLDSADKFKVTSIHSQIALTMCIMFEVQPKSTTAFDYSTIRLKCLKFADKYGYSNILSHCLNSFGSAKEIKDASKTEDFTVLSSETKAKVLYRVLDFI